MRWTGERVAIIRRTYVHPHTLSVQLGFLYNNATYMTCNHIRPTVLSDVIRAKLLQFGRFIMRKVCSSKNLSPLHIVDEYLYM